MEKKYKLYKFVSIRSTIIALFSGLGIFGLLAVALSQNTVSSQSRALIRGEIRVKGEIDGAVQQLSGADSRFEERALLKGDFFVTGSPRIRIEDFASIGSRSTGTGNVQPTDHTVRLEDNSVLRRLITRTNPQTVPTVTAPLPTSGTRDVVLTQSSQSPGTFATIRDLTLGENYGQLIVPSGNYRNFAVSRGSQIVLGVVGAIEPSSYNFNSLRIDEGSSLEVVGPVVLTIGNSLILGGKIGDVNQPYNLTLRIANGDLTLNKSGGLYAKVIAPNSTVTIDETSLLFGQLIANRLIINERGILRLMPDDTTPPILTLSEPAEGLVTNANQINVSGTVTDTNSVTVMVNNIQATVSGNSFTATVNLPTEGGNRISIRAIDISGNESVQVRDVIRDTIPPVLTVNTPTNDFVSNSSALTVSGTYQDSNPKTLLVNNREFPLTGNSFNVETTLANGSIQLPIVAIDAAGNQTVVERRITTASTLGLTVLEPIEGLVSRENTIRVSGNVNGTQASLKINGQTKPLIGETFFDENLTLEEGINLITFQATDIVGRTSEVTRRVRVDSTAPEFIEIFPAANSELPTGRITLQGKIRESGMATVLINDKRTTVNSNGNFSLTDFEVVQGNNTVQLVSEDELGNSQVQNLQFTGKDVVAPIVPTIFPFPTLTRMDSITLEGKAESEGIVRITGGVEPVETETARGNGLFFATVRLNPGVNSLSLSVADQAGNVSAVVSLNITSEPNRQSPPVGQAYQINTALNDAQRGLIGQALRRPLIARVTDSRGNPVENVPVTFTVLHGQGRLNGENESAVVITDAEGRASANYQALSVDGLHLIRADFSDNLATPANFSAEILTPNPNSPTTVNGIVQDQNLRALPNARIRLGEQEVRTGADGRFRFENATPGDNQLIEVIGIGEVRAAGRYPNISFDIDVLPNVENSLGRPLFLPRVNPGELLPLDENNVLTRDFTYTLPVVGNEPPIKIVARAGTQVDFPTDSSDRRFSITRIASDRVPNPLDEGRSANLFISVQPSGTRFSQPLEISFPNLDRTPANEQVPLMSFSHELGRYVKVGSGRVSADGRTVISEPGSGISVAAWHALPPEPPVLPTTVLSHIEVAGNPAFEGKDVEVREASLFSQRAIRIGTETNAEGQVRRIAYRVVITLPRGIEPVASVRITAQAVTPTIIFDNNSFNPATTQLYFGDRQQISLNVEARGAANSQYTITCDNAMPIANVQCQGNTMSITGGDAFRNAGSRTILVRARGTQGGEVSVPLNLNLVRVDFDGPPLSFWNPVRGNIVDPLASTMARTFVFREDPNKEANMRQPKWLTIVLGGNQRNQTPGTGTLNYTVTPASARNFVQLESVNNFIIVQNNAQTAQGGTLTLQGVSATSATAGPNFRARLNNTYRTNNTNVGLMNIAVRTRVEVSVVSFIISDNLGNRATVSGSDVINLLQNVNQILGPQTGVFYNSSAVVSRLTQNISGPIINEDGFNILRGEITVPNFNRELYFVWDFRGPNVIAGYSPTQGGLIIDTPRPLVVAHEFGHSQDIRSADPFYTAPCILGCSGLPNDATHSNVQSELMFPAVDPTIGQTSGRIIPPPNVDRSIQQFGGSWTLNGGFSRDGRR